MNINLLKELIKEVVEEVIEKLDPVGKEDSDVNNDKKVNNQDKYLLNKRKSIRNAIKKSKKLKAKKKSKKLKAKKK